MVDLRVRPDQASDGDYDDDGDNDGCGCSREISRFARDSRYLWSRSIVRECVATRQFYDLKTDECLVNVVSLRLPSQFVSVNKMTSFFAALALRSRIQSTRLTPCGRFCTRF